MADSQGSKKIYRSIATLDTDTCLICAVLDGVEFDSLLKAKACHHEGCRCRFEEVEDGDSNNAKGSGFRKFFSEMTEDKKKSYLGEYRYSLMKKYDLKLDDFVNKDELREYSFEEVRDKYENLFERVAESIKADNLARNEALQKLDLEAKFFPHFNFAIIQNNIKIFHSIKLINKTSEDIENITCNISSYPNFIIDKSIVIKHLKPNEELVIDDIDIELNYDFIVKITDTTKGKLKILVKSGEENLLEKSLDCAAYAVDQWFGDSLMPEMIASFVTPNADIVVRIQNMVGKELEDKSKSSSVCGYQGGRSRAYEMCASIYRAIHSLGIMYSNPPASFGTPGQKIRLADTIYRYKLGTCLDTTILFASVMEACGLNPVIMLQKGHAYIGCHLGDRSFSELPMENLQIIRKLVDADEFLVIETTMVTGDNSFAAAEACARSSHLNIGDDFEYAIDIMRARAAGIQPLSIKKSDSGDAEYVPVAREVKKLEKEEERKLAKEVDLSKLEDKIDQPQRVERWTKKLLDLTLRNRLLNVKDSKFVIPIACLNIGMLEDKIAAKESLTLKSLEGQLSAKEFYDLSMLKNTNISSISKSFIFFENELKQRRLYSILTEGEMSRRLTMLYRQGKVDLEESGVNTIYLAIGFLSWRESEKSQDEYFAPILLLPVQLKRMSISEGITISRIDGDTIVNETLLEMLRSRFGITIPGLHPLPTDDSGVDVALVMQIFKQSVKEMKGWEVREEARIGHFSFGKFVMWTDMTSRIDELKKNPLIEHLISGGGLYDDGIEVFNQNEISSYINYDSLYCPMNADSSQLSAVLYSQMGKSFVLYGPPGTGKSQTITNIIAHNLAFGRKVLFVSEKKAALDVVHNRLTQIGLNPFCLELHSNKSGKAEVMQQFSKALQVADTEYPMSWDSTVKTLSALRNELDEYVKELHKEYENGFSAYDCMTNMVEIDDAPSKFDLDIDCLSITKECYQSNREKIRELVNIKKQIDRESFDALNIFDNIHWSPILENNIIKLLGDTKSSIEKLIESFQNVARYFNFDAKNSFNNIFSVAVILDAIKTSSNIPSSFFEDDVVDKSNIITEFATNSKKMVGLGDKLSSFKVESFKDIDLKGVLKRIEENNLSSSISRFFKNNKLLKELSYLKKSGGAQLTIEELVSIMPDASSYVVCEKKYEGGKEKIAQILGKEWNGIETDWDGLGSKVSRAQEIVAHVNKLVENNDIDRISIVEKLKTIMPNIETLCKKGSQMRDGINILFEAWNNFRTLIEELGKHSSKMLYTDEIDCLIRMIDNASQNISSLRSVLMYIDIKTNLEKSGLLPVISLIEEQALTNVDCVDLYDSLFFKTMFNQILNKSPVLCRFNGREHNERIKRFKEIDSQYVELTKRMVFAKLASNLPRRRLGPCPEGTELGTLKRECEKKSRHKSIRLLLEQIPTIAQTLKPCFLMSPLSVAQYLPKDWALFDLVIFDEASQIPVWDAIGVIARGKQLIVVGDPKQMPPTNFFQKTDGDSLDEEIDEEINDMESILDECIAAGMHQSYLSWHYRSKHESLIAFSNHNYYDGKLLTFPAAKKTDKLGVRFEFVKNGVYDKKKTRTNKEEAKALVKYVFNNLDYSIKNKRSIGVVTFSQSQKELIEDMIEKERSKNPKYESVFSDDNEEPFFVKNLENVQGDERDVILFSIGYAPDAEGKFSMNFGPLNRQGGERRLNVAVTRAKQQIVVFSSIHSEMIDLSRTSAVGAKHLKSFLEYAEKGMTLYNRNIVINDNNPIFSDIEKILDEYGYKYERHVGSSRFRVDIAVLDKDNSSEYLFGIVFDNESYASQHTTRDRDSLQKQILKGLGWKIYNAWCIDWVFDKKRAIQDFRDFVDNVKLMDVSKEDEKKEICNEEFSQKIDPEKVSSNDVTNTNVKEVTEVKKPIYEMWENTRELSEFDFHEESNRDLIRQVIDEIVQKESPIYLASVKKRLVKAWGFAKINYVMQKIIDECVDGCCVTTKYAEDTVLWASQEARTQFTSYRVADSEKNKRAIDEIPPEEIANAMYEVLVDFNSCEKDALFKETIKLFGLSIVTAKARKYLEFAFSVLKDTGRI